MKINLNRNIVEFRVIFLILLYSSAKLILIETQWNLESCRTLSWRDTAGILIETQWNLEQKSTCYHAVVCTYLNRNIVEFRESGTRRYMQSFSILIETQWNLELYHPVVLTLFQIHLNRNIVEFRGSLHKRGN